MDIKLFKEKLFSSAVNAGFTECELYMQSGKSFSVNIYNKDIEKYQNNSFKGVSFRGIFNNKMGYSYSEKISESVIDFLIKNAIENSYIISDKEEAFIYQGDKNYPSVNSYNEKINEITVNEKIEMAKKMESACLNYSDLIKNTGGCTVANAEEEIFIANTKGVELFQKSNYMIAYIFAIAEKNGVTKEAGEYWAGINIDNLDTENLGKKAAQKVISYLDAKSENLGTVPVVFLNKSFAEFFCQFISNFYAENVQKGFSLLKNKIGEKIANENITILDEPLLKDGLSSVSFDSEGVASFNKTVVENGILKMFLYNLKSAEKDNTVSTGNGFKPSFKSPVSTSVTNFYIKPSNVDFNEMISDIEKGILITELEGLHAGTNGISGDFSIASSGFLILNGKISSPVEQITIAGNFYNVLKNIKNVSSDLEFLQNSVGSPSVYVEGINIAGN